MKRGVPAVSVVIPAYNAAGFIEKTLDSVRAQTYGFYEVIVVDDGSSDDTHGVVERYLKRHRISGRVLRQANKKIAAARNAGVHAAAGAFIAFLDHDDLWLPEKLAAVMEEFLRHPEADLVCHNENIIKDGAIVGSTRNGPAVSDMYERLLFIGNTLSPSAVTVRKSRVLQVGGFREDLAFNTVEDYDLWMRLARVCRFRFLDRVLGHYVLVASAASGKILYHYGNLENLLRDHFASYPGGRWRKKRRLARVRLSAAKALWKQGERRAALRRALGAAAALWT